MVIDYPNFDSKTSHDNIYDSFISPTTWNNCQSGLTIKLVFGIRSESKKATYLTWAPWMVGRDNERPIQRSHSCATSPLSLDGVMIYEIGRYLIIQNLPI